MFQLIVGGGEKRVHQIWVADSIGDTTETSVLASVFAGFADHNAASVAHPAMACADLH